MLLMALGLTILAMPFANNTVYANNDVVFTTRGSLFQTTGELSALRAQQILDAIGDLSNEDNVIDRETPFRLFPTVATNYARELSQSQWRIVDVDGDNVTMFATQPYRSSYFNVDLEPNITYGTSTLRHNLVGDWNVLASAIPRVNDHVNRYGGSANGANANDRIWIPCFEANNVIWHFNSHLGANQLWWARGFLNDTHALTVDTAGYSHGHAMTDELGVRPALHISLESLESAVEVGYVGNYNDNDEDTDTNDNDIDLLWIVLGSIGGFILLVGAISFIGSVMGSKKENRRR